MKTVPPDNIVELWLPIQLLSTVLTRRLLSTTCGLNRDINDFLVLPSECFDVDMGYSNVN